MWLGLGEGGIMCLYSIYLGETFRLLRSFNVFYCFQDLVVNCGKFVKCFVMLCIPKVMYEVFLIGLLGEEYSEGFIIISFPKYLFSSL